MHDDVGVECAVLCAAHPHSETILVGVIMDAIFMINKNNQQLLINLERKYP